ncbi:MAG: hypothetical protein JST55_14795 [Bacteroidetes bacterium]|nr:hypothetical protein [Bacteroidota bacterium]
MRKTIFILMITLLPSLLFSQGIHKTNIILGGGANFPIGGEDAYRNISFAEYYKGSYNLDIQIEYTAAKETVFGFEINHGKFAGTKSVYTYYPTEPGRLNITSFMGFLKVQDNSAKKDDIQFFVKGAVGLSFIADDNFQFSLVDSKGYGTGGISYQGGAGVNFMLNSGNKIMFESFYRTNSGKDASYNSITFNTGFSFCLNP